jgi:hypothetical protein
LGFFVGVWDWILHTNMSAVVWEEGYTKCSTQIEWEYNMPGRVGRLVWTKILTHDYVTKNEGQLASLPQGWKLFSDRPSP